jgi:CheY-like chemotaxis protein/HPt (histidine-containing phosphotransfer) domain-containing protein
MRLCGESSIGRAKASQEQAGYVAMRTGRRVLIVGDPALSRGLIKMVLSNLGYVVSAVAGGAEAATMLAHSRFALAMIALQLPDGSGTSLARRLRDAAGARDPLPIVLFGDAWDRGALVLECQSAGVSAYLEKPISIGRLVQTVRELTELDPVGAGREVVMSSKSSPVDMVHLGSFTDGDPQLERELGSLFLSSAIHYVEEMRQGLAAPAVWQRAAHALKGASASLGAVELAEIAREAERLEPSETMLSEIVERLDRVRGFLAGRGHATGAEAVSPRP